MLPFDINSVKTPCYVIDTDRLKNNLEILAEVKRRSGCKILLAQKAFSCYGVYPLISAVLDGTTASSLFEAKLGHDEFGGETQIFSAAYRPEEFDEVVGLCDKIIFNSFSQFDRYSSRLAGKSAGIRVDPGYSEIDTPLYDPCEPGSRLGVTARDIEEHGLDGIDGIHFHALCEQGADVLERVLSSFEKLYGSCFDRMKWVNFGGGHHITRPGYDIEKLISLIRSFSQKYSVSVYLEPGEAVALNAGYLVTTVLDTVSKKVVTAIIDASAECHMPDVLEMPYRPIIDGAGIDKEKAFTYRIASQTCLAGDVVGDYSFDHPLKPGDRLVFDDMAIYSMVKNNTFNGIGLPFIYICKDGKATLWKSFGYDDFKSRL